MRGLFGLRCRTVIPAAAVVGFAACCLNLGNRPRVRRGQMIAAAAAVVARSSCRCVRSRRETAGPIHRDPTAAAAAAGFADDLSRLRMTTPNHQAQIAAAVPSCHFAKIRLRTTAPARQGQIAVATACLSADTYSSPWSATLRQQSLFPTTYRNITYAHSALSLLPVWRICRLPILVPHDAVALSGSLIRVLLLRGRTAWSCQHSPYT